ncbi:MAG TPA: hypothetical protein VMD30_10270 [Tepidisphaeraceae bacterium]|nr:hypothetical protein [Tepidisphaeraceae bacterium]
MLPDAPGIADRLIEFQAAARQSLIASRKSADLHAVNRATAADTIYQIDTVVEPVLDEFCRQWAKKTPLVLIAEGIADESGREGMKIYPEGSSEDKATIRLIVDPIDGTRGLMYDKRSAWALAGVAPNKGPSTRLRDIEVSVMTELPTSKMGFADVLWAIAGQPSQARRVDLRNSSQEPLPLAPSRASDLDHGFAMLTHFFPATKPLAGLAMQYIVEGLGGRDPSNAVIFDDQYISTGGQFYELIVGHDRFNADLRPLFYEIQKIDGLCCHPYDCAGWLIAQQAGVILTDSRGNPLDGPLDVTSPLSWVGYANATLRSRIEPLLAQFLKNPALSAKRF